MSDLTRLDNALDAGAGTCLVVVETPRGARFKFNYDPAAEAFRLKSRLPEGLSFPLDFGFVPATTGGDGDPLDVMILAEDPLPQGLVAEVRLIGVLEAEDGKDGRTNRNDRLLATPAVSRLYASVRAPHDLPQAFIAQLCEFWTHKDRLEGKTFRLLAVREAGAAVELVRRASRAAAGQAA